VSVRCVTETLLELGKMALILLKKFLTELITPPVDFVLLFDCFLRVFDALEGVVLSGFMIIFFVRYIQLKTRMAITASGRR
jgi:hypothetical protein